MNIQVGNKHVKTYGADLDESVGHSRNSGEIESMPFQEEGQRYSDAFLVIDEKNARALRDAAGADDVLGSDAFEFAQKKLPAATKGLRWLLGDLS
jgi:hypothetical protein